MFRSKEFKGLFVEDASHVPYGSNCNSNSDARRAKQPLRRDSDAGWEFLVEEVKEQLRRGVASEINADHERRKAQRKNYNSMSFSEILRENGFHGHGYDNEKVISLSSTGGKVDSKTENHAIDTDDIDIQVLWAAAVVELAKKEAEVRRLKEQVDDLQAIEAAAEEMMGVLERLSNEPPATAAKEPTRPALEPFNLARVESAIQKLEPSSALRECLSIALENGHGKLVEDAAIEAAALFDRNQMNARAADAALQLAKSAVANQLTPPGAISDTTALKVQDMARQRPWCASFDSKQQSLKEMKQDSLTRQVQQQANQGIASFEGWTHF